MHVAVVIVSYRNPDDVAHCLESLGGSTHTDFEVAICENGGAAAAERLRPRAPAALPGGQPVRVIMAPSNLGFAGGVNHCLDQIADADAYWILNPDTRAGPHAMSALVDRVMVGDVDAAGCTIELARGVVQSHGGHWRSWLGRAESMGYGGDPAAPVDPAAIEMRQNYLNGASMLVTRRFLSVAHRMREDYFLYCEEIEWCIRSSRLGLRLGYAPGGRVVHIGGSTTGAGGPIAQRSRLSVYLNARNAVLLTRDLFAGRVVWVALALVVQQILRYALRGAWRQASFGISGVLAGLRDERGPPAWLKA